MSPRLGEADLIARYFAPLAGSAGLGLRDDAALMRPLPGEDLVLTTDALVAGVHFFADDPPGAIARKALRVNLSDLAAKAARPLGFLLTLALPPDWRDEWLAGFAEGLCADVLAFKCPLIGGDTVATPGPLTLSVTAIGSVAQGRMPKRTGVRPGDRLYVTGTIGDAAIGLRVRLGRGPDIAQAEKAFLLERYLTPEPRLKLIGAMAAHANGGMDVSDGFVGDLAKMLDVSGVTARVPIYRLPLSRAARAAIAADPDLFEVAATGGDDYELLASAPRESAPAFEAAAAATGVPLTFVGEAVEGRRPPSFIGPDGNPVVFERGAYSHFLTGIKMTSGASTLMDMRLLAAQAVAREAGAMARRRFLDQSFTIGFKGPHDYLTEVDGETEAFIAERLLQVFPTDGFIGEESKARPPGEGGAAWVVDPIDGTANFARGVPHFCVSIACVADERVEVGVIYDPILDELFASRRGGGARMNGALIRASDVSSLASSAVEVGWNVRAGPEQFVNLLRRVASTGASPSRTGSGALALAYVAAGRRDGFVEHHINAWDCLAGILLVEEAGGYVSDYLRGDGLTNGNPLVACAAGVKDALIAAAAFEGPP